MNKLLLLLICAILTGEQVAFGAASNGGSSPSTPSSTIYYGSVNFNRALPGDVAKSGQPPMCWVEGVTMCAYDYGIDEVNRLAKEGVLVGSDSAENYISLEQGNILLNPDKDIIVATSEGKISISSGATVFVMQSTNGLVVYDIAQTKPQQVKVTAVANKKNISLEAGRILVLTRQNVQDFEQLNVNCHVVAYSKVQPLDWQDNIVKAFLGNFSIASALVSIEPLKRLTVSQNKRDRLTLAKLTKNAKLQGDRVPGMTVANDFANGIDNKPIQVADCSP